MDPASPPEVTSTASNTVKVNGVEVTSDASKPTVINITVNHPPPQSCVLDTVQSLGKALKPLGDGLSSCVKVNVTSPVRTCIGLKGGMELARVMIGVAAVSLGIVLSAEFRSRTSQTGAAFWTGVPFIVSGILPFISRKNTSGFWNCATSLMNLASLVVAIAGIAVISDDLSSWSWYSYDWDPYRLCHAQQNDYYNSRYQTNPYRFGDDNDVYREQRCKDVTAILLRIFSGVRILLLLLSISGMISSLYSVGSDLWTLCCTSRSRQDNTVEDDVEQIGPTMLPPAYEEKQHNVKIV